METSKLNSLDSLDSMTARKRALRMLSPVFPILFIFCVGLPAHAQIEVGRHALGFRFAERNNLPHGVAADALHIFVTEPLNGRVAVINRITGNEIAVIPPPPGGFLLPFGARIDGERQACHSGLRRLSRAPPPSPSRGSMFTPTRERTTVSQPPCGGLSPSMSQSSSAKNWKSFRPVAT